MSLFCIILAFVFHLSMHPSSELIYHHEPLRHFGSISQGFFQHSFSQADLENYFTSSIANLLEVGDFPSAISSSPQDHLWSL